MSSHVQQRMNNTRLHISTSKSVPNSAVGHGNLNSSHMNDGFIFGGWRRPSRGLNIFQVAMTSLFGSRAGGKVSHSLLLLTTAVAGVPEQVTGGAGSKYILPDFQSLKCSFPDMHSAYTIKVKQPLQSLFSSGWTQGAHLCDKHPVLSTGLLWIVSRNLWFGSRRITALGDSV